MLRDYASKVQTQTFVPRADKVVFEHLAQLIKDDYELNDRSCDTLRTHHNHLRPFFQRFSPVNYTPALVKQYQKARLEEGAAIASVNREVACLSRMLTLAFECDMLPPAKTFKLLDGENVREGFLAPGDFYKILDKLEEGHRQHIAEFVYLSGWRSGKAKSLEWKHIDLSCEPPVARIGGEKRNSTKRVGIELPLTGRLLAIIQERIKARRLECPYVFHHRDGRKIGRFIFAWYGACKRAGYPPIMVHDFRRSAARAMSEAGVRQEVIMARAGWVTTSTFRRYRIVSTGDMVKANDQYEKYIEENLESKVTKIG